MSCNYNKMIYKVLMFGCWPTHPPKKTKKSSKVINVYMFCEQMKGKCFP